jgi:hypothetical protein
VGATITLRGKLLRSGLEPVVVSVAYEPFPKPLSVAQLNATSTYALPGGEQAGEIGQRVQITGDQVQASVVVGSEGKAGLYQVRLWVTVSGQQALAVNRIVEVR